MRIFQRLNNTEEEKLDKLFPDLDKLYQGEDSNHYKHLSISVFDHILSDGEAREQLDGVTLKQARLNDSKLHNFCCALALNNECYALKPIGMRKQSVAYRKFLSPDGVYSFLEPKPYNWGSKDRFVLALPRLEAIYFEFWDFTHHVYYKHKSQVAWLSENVKEHGVFILE